jgi:hypothetical protein
MNAILFVLALGLGFLDASVFVALEASAFTSAVASLMAGAAPATPSAPVSVQCAMTTDFPPC